MRKTVPQLNPNKSQVQREKCGNVGTKVGGKVAEVCALFCDLLIGSVLGSSSCWDLAHCPVKHSASFRLGEKELSLPHEQSRLVRTHSSVDCCSCKELV